MTNRHEVVVVGGGIAGLSAARTLQDEGIDVAVLEARERVGGKTHSAHTEYGDVVEYGGQWVGADQERVLAVVDEFGIDTRPQYHEGDVVTRTGGDRHVAATYEDAFRSLPEESAAELFAVLEEVEQCVEQVPRSAPQDAPRADEWDATTLQSWVDRRFDTEPARAAFERMIPGIYTADAGEFSFLFFCYYARTCGGFDVVAGFSDEVDSHEAVVVDVQAIARSLAAELGDRVRYKRPARRIVQDDDGVTVETPAEEFAADYAVVALPPTLAGRLDYDPPLPPARDELAQRMPNGTVVKCHLRYDAPFWRDAGFSGVAEDDAGPANYYFDDGYPDGETGRMVGFICGDAARTWAERSQAARRDALADQLVALFDDDRFGSPVDYLDRAWTAEPYSRGAYHGYPTPGTMTACWDALREPVGRIHWAGAETATRWYGHMDGAIRSGERAAGEIRERLDEGGLHH